MSYLLLVNWGACLAFYGFFEWRREGTGKAAVKQPLYFHPENRRIFAFAGLWARARTDAGEILSFTIITGPPNALVKPVHDRMPIVLAESVYDAWLDPSLDPFSRFMASVGAFWFGFSQLMILWVVIKCIRGDGAKAPAKPWEGADTLEWTVPSPAPYHTFETPPAVK